jgi:pyridoxamine 5'-phosphate oxidase
VEKEWVKGKCHLEDRVEDLRQNYTQGELLESSLPESPFGLFQTWFTQASESEAIKEPNAMVLSTQDGDRVDSRIVLLKGLEDSSFLFYSNYESHKGKQLLANDHCTLLFPWVHLERQIIIRGRATKQTEEKSAKYFSSRPRASQLGAWASEQSDPINSREDLQKQLVAVEAKFMDSEVSKPPHWGGYVVHPYEIEFWQGRESRLHDRILYTKIGDSWQTQRLQP